MWHDINNYDADVGSTAVQARQEIQSMLDANYKKLVPFYGERLPFNGNYITQSAIGTQIQLDIVFSGQYELDPQYWFV
jgi:hypothetical protein